MSPLGTVIVAWAAVYAYVATYFCMLYARRRGGREYLAFGLLAACISVVSVGDVVLLQAESPAQALLGVRLSVAAMVLSLPFFVEFCMAAVTEKSRLVKVSYGWALLGLAAVLFGVATATGRPTEPLFRVGGARAVLAHARPWMTVYMMMGWTVGAMALTRLLAAGREDAHVRILFVSLLISLVAGTHDLLFRVGLIESYPLLNHTGILAVFAMSYVLLDRFARTTEALQQRTFELNASYDRLRDTHERLVRREQLAALGELSAVIAHEVRNPLAVIKNAVSGLRRPNLRPEDHRTLLDILDEEVLRLNRLMRDLLAYARPIAPRHEAVALTAIVERVADALDDRDDESGLRVDIDVAATPPVVSADPALLEQAFLNIASNAAQAMPDGGTLTITIERVRFDDHDGVSLRFDDEGRGMSEEVRDKALTPFFTTRPTGTGLGLPIVDCVVRNHGGRLELSEAPSGGARLEILLPIDRVSAFPAPMIQIARPEDRDEGRA